MSSIAKHDLELFKSFIMILFVSMQQHKHGCQRTSCRNQSISFIMYIPGIEFGTLGWAAGVLTHWDILLDHIWTSDSLTLLPTCWDEMCYCVYLWWTVSTRKMATWYTLVAISGSYVLLRHVVIWIRVTPIQSYSWMPSHEGPALLGKD